MRRSNESGAAAVELALVAPVLLVLILGIIDFGFAFNAKIAVTQAAREGARVVALGGTDSDATTRVNETLTTSGQIFAATTTVLAGCGSGSDATTVRVEGSTDTILPIPAISLAAEGVMRCTG